MALHSVLPFVFNPTETQKHSLPRSSIQGQQFLKVVGAFQYKKLPFQYTVNAIKY